MTTVKPLDPPTPGVGILVADHVSEWRAQVRDILQARPEWQIICEACDGQEAVQVATALHPDIVLLDIGAHPERPRSCPENSRGHAPAQNSFS